jgi:hypothetical protein
VVVAAVVTGAGLGANVIVEVGALGTTGSGVAVPLGTDVVECSNASISKILSLCGPRHTRHSLRLHKPGFQRGRHNISISWHD